jgi:hypothetical protein
MRFKKMLYFLFLGPVISIIGGIPGEVNSEKDNDSGKDGKNTDGKEEESTDNNKNDDSKDKENSKDKEDKEMKFTQKDLDTLIEKRLKRERNKLEDEFKKEIERSKMSAEEKAIAEKEDAQKKANEAISKANSRLIRSEVTIMSANMNLIDNEAAYALIEKDDIEVDKNGKVTGVEIALKELIAKKPWLVKNSSSDGHKRTGDDQSVNSKGNKNFNFNDLIRKAAGR